MNKNLKVAEIILRSCRDKFYDAEQFAREQLKFVLEPCGEHGVSICPLDFIEDEYESFAEVEPHQFHPIALIRYWNGKLEVFVSDYVECADGRLQVLADGQWVDYVDAKTDTWFMLDQVSANLEWADGYQDTKKYTFRFHHHEWTDITVEAASEEDAAELASDKYNAGEYEDDVEAFENMDMENITEED